MVIIRNKYESKEQPVPEITIDNKLELVKYLAQVESRIKNHITSDFTYAKLNEKDRTYCLEVYKSASLGLALLTRIKLKALKQWTWQNGYWIKKRISAKEEKILEQYGEMLFDTFMKQIYMIAVLNRNVKDNYLIKYSMSIPEEDENRKFEEEEMRGFMEKAKRVFKNEEKEQK